MSLIKSIGNKKVNFDFNKDFITIFSEKIKIADIGFINQTLKWIFQRFYLRKY